ncbi:flp pilus-assembly TadE/G-like family protein [Nocardioides sp. SOB77]|uniref:Flp pilus-assembly TadE/G-like family protein n=1 Tax=Nocardioides oceani TaxID=3058369 RepID=A0ABT8FB46_9ACTN|nr:Rv3654c family TadE-like protein [Nocardioides oceani]MDN4171918.1 flp pilus-assembly TadE/G-like family protein [Nocardioides oceani]
MSRSVHRSVDRPSRAGDERGSVTLFAIGCLALLLLVGSALGVVAAMVRAHRTAQAAADLAALAGAATIGGPGDPCAAAATVADRNGAALLACTVEGRDVRVRAQAPGPRWMGQVADLAAEARAGPS